MTYFILKVYSDTHIDASDVQEVLKLRHQQTLQVEGSDRAPHQGGVIQNGIDLFTVERGWHRDRLLGP